MNVFRRMGDVRRARARAELARLQWHTATNTLLARGREHPVAMVGAAAGIGLLMGRCNVRPWRVPGLGALLGGGLTEGVAFAMRLMSEFGLAGLTRADSAPEDGHDGSRADGDKRPN